MKLNIDDEEEGSDEVSTSHQCVGCLIWSPKTTSGHTLISAQYGWRLLREMRDGEMALEWRCASCWQRHKLAKGSGGEAAPSSRTVPQSSRQGEPTAGSRAGEPATERSGDMPPESAARPASSPGRPPLSELIRGVFTRKS
jgi:hypothetical protein